MTRMIERWFPCAEVTASSGKGWGSGNTESSLWVWFAKRPVAQSKAAVLTSLLAWPDDPDEQARLMALVRLSLTGYRKAQRELEAELRAQYGRPPSALDPFSGRAMIPLEVGRLSCNAFGVDYSPLAALGGQLLADLIHRDWQTEKPLPLGQPIDLIGEPRLQADARAFLAEVGSRQQATLEPYYPKHEGKYPWGYLWASTLPCQEWGTVSPWSESSAYALFAQQRMDLDSPFTCVQIAARVGSMWSSTTARLLEHQPGSRRARASSRPTAEWLSVPSAAMSTPKTSTLGSPWRARAGTCCSCLLTSMTGERRSSAMPLRRRSTVQPPHEVPCDRNRRSGSSPPRLRNRSRRATAGRSSR
jgi:hypothetical protein